MSLWARRRPASPEHQEWFWISGCFPLNASLAEAATPAPIQLVIAREVFQPRATIFRMIRISLFLFLISVAAAQYSVTVIPAVNGSYGATMYGINNSGQVAGQSPSTGQAFLGAPQGSTLIPLPAGWQYAYGNAVNNSGQVAGTGSNGVFIGSLSGSNAIPVPNQSSEAFAVNDAGQVAGYFPNGVGNYIGTPAGVSLIPFPSGSGQMFVTGINNSGQVTGWANFSNGARPISGTSAGTSVLPAPLGWLFATGYALNDSGTVAGSGGLSGSGPQQGFVSTTSASFALPLPSGATTATVSWSSISAAGQVVGSSDAGGWIWDSVNGTRLLSALVPQGWKVDGAFSISESGLILASASYEGGPGLYVELKAIEPTSGCTFSLSQPTAFLLPGASGGTVDVVTAPGCTWSAASNATWLTISSNTSGSGNGSVSFQMAYNPGAVPRVGVLTIGGLTFPVTQDGAGVPLTLTPTSVNPGAGSGTTQTFTFSFTDQAGFADLSVLDVLINDYLDGQKACYFALTPSGASSGYLYLVNDAGNGGYASGSPMQLGSSGTLENSQCSIPGASASVSTSGNNLTLTLTLTFREGFSGNKIIYTAARSNTQNSGWQAIGTWNVPGTIAPQGPAVGTMFPARSTTAANVYNLNYRYSADGTYTFTFTDTNGFADLGVVDILVNDSLDGVSACYLAYVPNGAAAGYLYLVDDQGDGGYAPGSPLALSSGGVLGNSQCDIYLQGSSASASGNTLTLNVRFLFDNSFKGNRIFYVAARNNQTGNSGWQAVGSVTVP
jgi:hypothetical protein